MTDVESLERATLAAVPPQALEEVEGWLVALDDGTVGRAHSAAPTRHDAQRLRVEDIESRYRARGLATTFRVPKVKAFDALREELAGRGYSMEKPTLVQWRPLEARAGQDAASETRKTLTAEVREPARGDDAVRFSTAPGDAWAAMFLGDGFDPVDAASRLAILRRSTNSIYAWVEEEGRVAAVGSACFSHGWCGIHGMRTAPAHRGRGMASRILAAFAQEARVRGIDRAFLQVEQGNAMAQSVYGRAGFTTLWAYEYWRS